MGYLTLVLTSFTFLLAYSLISGTHAKSITSPSDATLPTANELQKRPTYVQLKGFPYRRLKPLALFRRDFQPAEVEFIDDQTVNDMEKNFDDYEKSYKNSKKLNMKRNAGESAAYFNDDYGHSRFGKRGEDSFDDYGHMR